MLEEAAGSTNQNIHAVDTTSLFLHFFPTNQETRRKCVVAADLSQFIENLDRELSRRRDDQASQSVWSAPASAIQPF